MKPGPGVPGPYCRGEALPRSPPRLRIEIRSMRRVQSHDREGAVTGSAGENYVCFATSSNSPKITIGINAMAA